MKVLHHLDFDGKAQILKITIEKLSSPPTGWAGRVYYNTTNNTLYWHNGTMWIAINDTSGFVTSIIGGGGITVSGTGTVTIGVDVDDATLELSDGTVNAKVRIKDLGVGTGKLANDAVTTIKVTDKNITFAKIQDIATMTVIGRIASGSGVSSAITILTSLESVIAEHNSLASAKAIKDYVDGIVGGIGNLQGGWDANTNNVYPSASPSTSKGDYWYITAAGTIQGVNYDAGDVIIANQNSASTTNPAHWISLEVNREQATTTTLGVVRLAMQAEARAMTNTQRALTPSNLADVKATDGETQTGSETNRFISPANLSSRTATEARTGIAAIATQSEVNAGTDDTKIVTPAKLAVYVANQIVYASHVADIGNGSATQISVTHSFGTRDVKVEVWDNATYETVLVTVTRTSTAAVTFTFAEAPALNAYRVKITK